MLTGRILSENGRENVECYFTGDTPTVNGGLPIGTIATPPNGRVIGIEWAIPCSTNGVTVTGFTYEMATNGTKPRADAVKVIVVEDVTNGGSYKKIIVPDAYTISDFVEAACAGCDAIAEVTVVEPLIFMDAACYVAPPETVECNYQGSIYVEAFTGSNNTYTATAYGYKADGTAIVFAPSTSTGTSVALLAADMQTNWASELGTGTFTATGNVIEFNSTNGAKIAIKIAQSEV